MNNEAIKNAVAQAAQKLGVQGYEISISTQENAGAEALQHEISSVSYSRSSTMQVRCVVDGKSGYATSELVTPEAAAELVEQAVANAAVVDDADTVGLFEGSESYAQVHDPEVVLPSAEQMKAHAMQLQEKTYAASGKIVDGTQCWCSGLTFSQALMNSAGLDVSYQGGLVYRGVAAAVMEGQDAANDYRVKALDFEDADTTVQKAVQSALDKLGAEPVDSGKYDLIMDSGTVCSLLSTYAEVFSARSAYLKTTLLAGKEGQMVASGKLTLVDDPFHPGKFGHCPFDGEGVAVYTKNIIEKGELKTLLYNRMYAKLLDKQTTGNAADSKHISPKGMYVAPGDLSAEALLEKLGDGLYITGLNGLHAGANVQSGDFSLQAEGFLVEGGKKTRAVKNITIADNFFQLLKKVDAISDTVIFGTGSDFGAPEILFKDIAVSGK